MSKREPLSKPNFTTQKTSNTDPFVREPLILASALRFDIAVLLGAIDKVR